MRLPPQVRQTVKRWFAVRCRMLDRQTECNASCPRLVTGACVAASGSQMAALGAVLGVVGGIVGCFGGYQARTRLVKALGTPDFVVAVLEDLLAIGGSLFVVSRF